TGGSTATSTVPGCSVVELRPATDSEFLITIGTMGSPVAIAIRNAPFLNGPTDWVSSRVPSGAIRTDTPLRAASSMGAMAAPAERAGRHRAGRADRGQVADPAERPAAAPAAEPQEGPAAPLRHRGQPRPGVDRPRVADQVHQRQVLVPVRVEVAGPHADAVL